uniref:THAP-type domain-containing protein n=1 Tax=Myripristis murdjan TaxID=586833 RepID=A0A667Y0C1_9TELE
MDLRTVCVVCPHRCKETNVSLHTLPKETHVTDQCPNLLVCLAHFSADCFINLTQYNAGFAKKLLSWAQTCTVVQHHTQISMGENLEIATEEEEKEEDEEEDLFVCFSGRPDAYMRTICPKGHPLWRWNSQPVMKFGMQAGDFLLSTNILLSGNNYAKVALLFKFMNMGMVNKNTFFSIQDTYCVDTIKEFWEEKRTEAISRLQGKDVLVLADGRNDSPGHCAQYCSYTTMENDTKEIIHVATIDKRQTSWNSVIMEKQGFIETMDKHTSEIKLVEICTDAHAQIGALMSNLDMWHGAKNLAKKTKIKGQSLLLNWLKDIINHFWWCCKTCSWFSQTLWTGILHHRDSKCHNALVDIVYNKRLQKDVHKYLSTADLEAFQNHILMYASKRYAFSPPVYEARVLLAALDYNFHRNQPTLKTADGKEM